MFTGLVEYVGTIDSVELTDIGAREDSSETRPDQIGASIRVHAGPLLDGLAKSGSIAVNGCCLTAVDISKETFAADLSGETLRRTSLGEMKPGTRVNLERPLTAW
jgi:riboflavin synthase